MLPLDAEAGSGTAAIAKLRKFGLDVDQYNQGFMQKDGKSKYS